MHNDQVGQLDPSRVSITTDLDGGKLINEAIAAIVRYVYESV